MKDRRRIRQTWRRWLVVVGSPLVAIILSLVMAMPAMAATVTNVDIPLSGTIANPCNGEILTFNGVDHLTSQVTVNSGGGFHYSLHDNIHVTGVGDQGNSYVGNQEDNSDHNFTSSSEATSTLSFNEISQGSAPNFVVSAVFHITFTPAGIVTAYVNNYTTSCRG